MKENVEMERKESKGKRMKEIRKVEVGLNLLGRREGSNNKTTTLIQRLQFRALIDG